MRHLLHFQQPVRLLTYFIAALILHSCHSSHDVASNTWLQKRKYRPGFHFNLKKKTTLPTQAETALLPSKTQPLIEARDTHELSISDHHKYALAPTDQHELEPFVVADTGKLQAIKIFLSKLSKVNLMPVKTKSISERAEERYDELATLKQHKKKNKRALITPSIFTGLSIATIAFLAPILTTLGLIPFIGWMTAAAALFLISTSLMITLWKARAQLKKDRIFFTPERLEKLERITRLAIHTSLICLGILGVTYAFILVFGGLIGSALYYNLLVGFSALTGVQYFLSTLLALTGITLQLPYNKRMLKELLKLVGVSIGIVYLSFVIGAFFALIYFYLTFGY